MTPRVFEGGLHVDERGEVGFVTAMPFDRIVRFYTIRNNRRGAVRAWHAHKAESKYITVTQGIALVCAVAIDDWQLPSKTAPVFRARLSAKKPSVLYVPPGYANGFQSLSEDAQLLVFSDKTVLESQADDIRFEPDYWNPWER